jgi:hypothetical protein
MNEPLSGWFAFDALVLCGNETQLTTLHGTTFDVLLDAIPPQ